MHVKKISMEVNLYKAIRFPREELDHKDEDEAAVIDMC